MKVVSASTRSENKPFAQRRLPHAVGGRRAILRRRARLIDQRLVGGGGVLEIAVEQVAVAQPQDDLRRDGRRRRDRRRRLSVGGSVGCPVTITYCGGCVVEVAARRDISATASARSRVRASSYRDYACGGSGDCQWFVGRSPDNAGHPVADDQVPGFRQRLPEFGQVAERPPVISRGQNRHAEVRRPPARSASAARSG